jgi:hypothetical protein
MVSMDVFVELVGKSIDAPPVRARLESLALQAAVQKDNVDEGVEAIHTLSNQDDGFLIRHDPKGRIEVVFVYLVAEEGFSPFAGTLVGGLTSHAGRAEVRLKLGRPTRSGEAFNHTILGPEGAWDRYDTELVSLHFQYIFKGEGIRRVTIMAADVTP